MSPEEFKKIRMNLQLTQAELADILYISGNSGVSNLEIGFRNVAKLTAALMYLLSELSEKEAKKLIEGLLSQRGRVLEKKGGGRGKSKK